MAISRVGTPVTNFQAAGSTIVADFSSFSLEVGDWVLVFIRDQATVLTEDFTNDGGFERIGRPWPGSATNYGRMTGTYARRVTDVGTFPTLVTFSRSGADTRRVLIAAVYRGVHATTPVRAYHTTYNGTFVSENSRTLSSYGPIEPGDKTILLAGTEQTAGGVNGPTATPSGYDQVGFVVTTSATNVSRTSLWVGDYTADATSTDPATVTYENAAGLGLQGLTLAPASEDDPDPEPLPEVTGQGFVSVQQMLETPGATWAHRNLGGTYPEMTEYGARMAANYGHGVIEVSCLRTSDGVWVGTHDATPDRVALETTYDGQYIESLTSAQVLSLHAVVGPTGAPQPFARAIDIFQTLPEDFIFLVDPKSSAANYMADFLSMLDTYLGPERAIVKIDGAATLPRFQAAKAAGYLVAAYFYSNTPEQTIADRMPYVDIPGMNWDAGTTPWTNILSYGKPVWGHVCETQEQYNTCISKGATFVQCTTTAIAPVGVESWVASGHGEASITLSISGEASGSAPEISESTGSVAASLDIDALASGHAPSIEDSRGSVSGELTLTGEASGRAPDVTITRGAASGTLELEGLAEGHSPEVAVSHGGASGTLELSASTFGHAPGVNEAHGAAEGTISLEGRAEGYTPVIPSEEGAAEGTLVISGTATGSAPGVDNERHGSAVGTIVISAIAYGQVTEKAQLPRDPDLRYSEFNGVGVQNNTVYDKGADALTASDKLRLMSITGQTNNPRADPDPSFWYGNMPPTRSRRRPRPRYPRKRGTQA